MSREFTVEEDIECQRLVNELYELLEKYGLNSLVVFDPNTNSLKEVDSLCINGTALQVNSEVWSDE